MKAFLLSALTLASAVGLAVSTTCNLVEMETKLMANTTIAAKLTPAKAKCESDTGVDIFDIKAFPTKTVALKFQQSNTGCNVLINLVNGYANIDTQCTIVVNATEVIYGRLISDFLAGKTGNESDSGSSSASDSESDSGSSESGSSASSSSNSTAGSSSDASTTALSFVTYGAIAAIAVALR